MDFQIGMYVRCPIDGDLNTARTYFMGQVTGVDAVKGLINVVFHDIEGLRLFFSTLPANDTYKSELLVRTPILVDSKVLFKGKKVRILSISKKPDKHSAFYNYFVEYFANGVANNGEVSETQIQAMFTKANYNPINQMLNYELQNPKWYLQRKIVSKSVSIINNSPSGFKNLLGTRVHLFTHQVDTVIRALTEYPCRLMLADEVGLGKTIEALSIIKGMMDKRPNLKSLIVVPETLIYQWQTELSYKFWIDVPIWGVDTIIDPQIILVSTRDFINSHSEITKIERWDMCILDETHRVLYDDDLYNATLLLCENAENVLLLSATPILHRENEYHKLLTLLNPTRFKDMDVKVFGEILSKQRKITDIVFDLMRDLSDYKEYDLYEDFIDSLTQINNEINDAKLRGLISKIDPNSEDKGFSVVKIALSYIAEFYQIERNIIRHRRAELKRSIVIRDLVSIKHEMTGADEGFAEELVYNQLLDYIDFVRENYDTIDSKDVKLLISAVSSSPSALKDLLIARKRNLQITESEMEELESLIVKVDSWEKAVEDEIFRIKDVCDDVEAFHSKIAKVIDYVDQEDVAGDKKYLVFTGFIKTALRLEECFVNFFGVEAVTSFHREKTKEEMQDSASKFQDVEECRFMICDESGGEGRNFQKADFIIHFDLPWSPALIEQRIGRLDRIGRDTGKPVVSIVAYTNETIENDLFNLYHEGLNVFCESLCGMEIAFEQINNTIEDAMNKDVRFGLSGVIAQIKSFSEQIKLEIEKERYFDLARQLDIDLQEKLEKLIFHFSSNDGAELMNSMMAWPKMAGFQNITVSDVFKDGNNVVSIDTSNPNPASMLNTLYFPPQMKQIIKRSKYKNDIRGTFSRTAAVKHENLTFFAPYNNFYDSIMRNAQECYKGRCCALKFQNCKVKFVGLVTIWNARYDINQLLKKGYSTNLISLVSKYLPQSQIVYTKGITRKFDNVLTEDILEQIEISRKEKPIHLGKRGNKSIDTFKVKLPFEKWEGYINSTYMSGKKYAKEQARTLIESEKAKEELGKLLDVSTARKIFYGYLDDNIILKDADMIETIIRGLENPIIELDSMCFVMLEGE